MRKCSCAIVLLLAGLFMFGLISEIQAQTTYQVLSIYTSDGSGNAKRVFRINDDIWLNIVILNNSTGSNLAISPGNIIIQESGSSSNTHFPAISNTSLVTITPEQRGNIKVQLRSDLPEWQRKGFWFLGEKAIAEVFILNHSAGKAEFFVDEFSVPEWIQRGNAAVLAGLAMNHKNALNELNRFALYNPTK
jgi:hypothetical protein